MKVALKIFFIILVLILIFTNVSYAISAKDIENFTTTTVHDENLTMKDRIIFYIPIILTLISLCIFLAGEDISFFSKIMGSACFIAYIVSLFFSDGKLFFSIVTIALAIVTNLIYLLNEHASGTGKILSSLTIVFIAISNIINIL